MAISVGNLAPRAVVVGFVAVVCWPTLSKFLSREESKQPETLPELTATALAPKMPPLPTRDPFGLPAALKPAAPTNLVKAAAITGSKDSTKFGLSSDKMARRAGGSAAAKVGNQPVDPLNGLSLDGTCVMGEQRLAVINGRLYAPQEKLSADKSSTPAYQIVDVLPYKVLLERNGQILELGYSNVASRSASSNARGAKSGSAAGAKKSAKKTKSGGQGK